ncbi:MAG: glycosyltransferase family 4 protein [Bacteroidota bacterium]
MRIAYLCTSRSWGGLELNHLRNALWMHERGHKVSIFAPEGSPFYLQAIQNNLTCISIKYQPKYFAWKSAYRLARLFKEHDISHVFIRDNRDMSLIATLKSRMGDTICTCYFMEMQLGVSKRGVLHTLRFSYLDYWFCPLKGLAEQVRTMTRINPKKIHHLPSGIDLQGMKAMNKSEARRRLNLPNDAMIFGLPGRFDPQKGQLLALEALNLAQNKQLHLVFLGEPTKNEQESVLEIMERKIDQYQFKDRVFIRPFMKEMDVFFSSIDALLMATKAETFGMVTLEAMAYGVPVIGSYAGGTPELLGQGKFGILFETLNPLDLARAMDEMASYPPQIDAEALRNHVAAFDHQKVCHTLETLLATSNAQ